jgi:hypothetical protein
MIRPTFPLIFLQLRGPPPALSRKYLHDLTTALHFKSFFIICVIRIFIIKIEKFHLRGNNEACAGEFQLSTDSYQLMYCYYSIFSNVTILNNNSALVGMNLYLINNYARYG